MKITTLQITLDVVHGDDVDPTEVARHAGDIAHDSIVWTAWPELANNLDEAYAAGDAGVGIVSSIVIATRDYERGHGARSCDDEEDSNADETS